METKNHTRHCESAVAERIQVKQTSFSTKFSWFTLVELIVVITILIILGTIAFINLGGYSSFARDSTRIENLANLKKGLDVYQAKSGTYPLPEGPLHILASGSIIGYQGFAKEQTAWLAKLSAGGTKDPSDASIYTTYAVNYGQTKMQVMSFLENGGSVTAFAPLIPAASASSTSDYSQRTPTTKGDTMGILISTATGNLNQPLQEALSVSFTGIDVVVFSGTLSDGTPVSLKAQLSNAEGIAGTGGELMALESNMNTKMRLVMPACPRTWKDLGNAQTTGPLAVWCSNDGISSNVSPCKICETNNNAIIPTDSLILTQSGTCNGPSLNDTGWLTGTWLTWGWTLAGACDLSTGSCHMCKSVTDSPIPTGTITLMQSCPYSWKDIWTRTIGGPLSAGCLYGAYCRICQKQ